MESLFFRLMLKSLGQWTTPLKPRKIIPSRLTRATIRPPDNGQGETSTEMHVENEES